MKTRTAHIAIRCGALLKDRFMAKKSKKEFLFDKFSKQLSLLKENGIIDFDLNYKQTYICPICLEQFSKDDLEADDSKNFLTEEDAPPASLGGSRIALTCKRCNSKCGHSIDYQLKELIEHEENRNFIKGTIQKGTVDFEGKPITVQMESNGKGLLQAVHDEKKNNPAYFKRYINSIQKGEILHFKPKKHRLDSKKINYGFLKTNYIITFSKFGYIFLLDNAYDRIREQILEPEKDIIEYNLTIHNAHLKDHIGTHYILDNEIKAIFNIFKLKTKLSEKTYGSFLPIPAISIEKFVESMEKNIENHIAKFNKSIYDENADLFNDNNEIKKVINWIENNK